MEINQITRAIIDCAMTIHNRVGPGLYESVYETLLEYELKKRGLSVERQCPIPLVYDDLKFPDGFRADLLVEGKVIVEIKSVEVLAPVHFKQVLTYLSCGDFRVALLINFGEEHLKNGIKRIVNNYAGPSPSAPSATAAPSARNPIALKALLEQPPPCRHCNPGTNTVCPPCARLVPSWRWLFRWHNPRKTFIFHLPSLDSSFNNRSPARRA